MSHSSSNFYNLFLNDLRGDNRYKQSGRRNEHDGPHYCESDPNLGCEIVNVYLMKILGLEKNVDSYRDLAFFDNFLVEKNYCYYQVKLVENLFFDLLAANGLQFGRKQKWKLKQAMPNFQADKRRQGGLFVRVQLKYPPAFVFEARFERVD